MKHHPFIDGLRAVAVVPVIFFHYRPEVFPGGFAGVDVFFVLSGFLITGVLSEALAAGRFSLLHFYERRARRILPALGLCCLLTLALAALLFMPQDFEQFAHSLTGVAAFASNITFFEDVGYFAAPALVKPLLHTWSLAVEEQFYVLYPLLLLGLHRAARGDRRKMVAGVAALAALSLALSVALTPSQPEASFYFLHTRAWELLTGALVFFWLQGAALPRVGAEAAGIAGALLLALGYFALDGDTPFPGWAALAPCLGTALLVAANLHGPTLTGRALAWRPLVAIGLVSYGLYLYHWPLLVFARYVLERNLDWPETAAAIAATGVLAALSYRYVEAPLRRGVVLARRRALLTSSACLLVTLAALGIIIDASHGFPGRFDGAVLSYLTDDAPPAQECRADPSDGEDRQQWCRIGDLSKPSDDFVIWGDSHANRAAHGVNVLAKETGHAGWKISSHGCPPLRGLMRPGFAKYECEEANDAALAFIREKKIRTVILVGRWDLVQPPETGSVEDIRDSRDSRVMYVTPQGETLYGLPAFRAALAETLAQLGALGARVWIMEQAPPHLHYLSSALAKYAYFGRDVAALDRPLAEVLARSRPQNDILEAAAGGRVSTIDPLPLFCPGARCLASAAGHSLYKDNSHLSIYGAVWSRALWHPVFTEMARGR